MSLYFSCLGPLVDERPVEVVPVVGDDNLRSELGHVLEEPTDHGLLVGLVEDVERSRERRFRGVLKVLRWDGGFICIHAERYERGNTQDEREGEGEGGGGRGGGGRESFTNDPYVDT